MLLKVIILVGIVFAIAGVVVLGHRIHETNDRVLQLEKEMKLTYEMALASKETLDNLAEGDTWVAARVREILGLNAAMRAKAWRNLAGVYRQRGDTANADLFEQQVEHEDLEKMRTIAGDKQ